MTWSATAWILESLILLCLFLAAITDLTNRIIPNRLVAVILVSGLGIRIISGPETLLASLFMAIAVLFGLGLLASRDFIGWGDVKLIAALTIAVPVGRALPLFFAITMAGGLLSCAYLFARSMLKQSSPILLGPEQTTGHEQGLRGLVNREGARIRANEPMPYALAILGGFTYCLTTE